MPVASNGKYEKYPKFVSRNVVNDIYSETITSKSGEVYNRVALNTLMLALLRGKPDTVYYQTKTYHRFDITRRVVKLPTSATLREPPKRKSR